MSILFQCPHCKLFFIVLEKELNCRILRHFVFFNGEQLNPHASEEECARAVAQNAGYGCAGPIKLVEENGAWTAIKSAYE